jgi:hypothetical protein
MLGDMGEHVEHRRARWVWVSLLPLGLGSWAPIYAGRRAGRPSWAACGSVCALVTLVGWVLAIAGRLPLGALCVAAGWAGAVAVSFSIRRRSEQARPDQITARDHRTDPEALGGIHDADFDLVDVNSATLIQLLRVPMIDGTTAGRIIAVRTQVGGFASLDEMGVVLDLDGALVDGLRDWVVFGPRSSAAH